MLRTASFNMGRRGSCKGGDSQRRGGGDRGGESKSKDRGRLQRRDTIEEMESYLLQMPARRTRRGAAVDMCGLMADEDDPVPCWGHSLIPVGYGKQCARPPFCNVR